MINVTHNKGTAPETIMLGKQHENLAVTLQFDVSAWSDINSTGGVFGLNVRRCGERASYPCPITVDGTVITFGVRDIETEKDGAGFLELEYRAGDTVVRSATWKTYVQPSITDTAADPPDPYESWLETLTELGAETEQNAQAAAISAENAEEASERYPYIRDTDKHWMVWDVSAGEYKDTGVVAEGGGGGGTPTWTGILNKPFERLGANLKVVGDALTVDTADAVEQDNTRPITSAAVYTEVGNINALLALI